MMLQDIRVQLCPALILTWDSRGLAGLVNSSKDLLGSWLPCRHQGLSCGAPCVLAFSPEGVCCFLYFDWSLPDRADGKFINLAPVQ